MDGTAQRIQIVPADSGLSLPQRIQVCFIRYISKADMNYLFLQVFTYGSFLFGSFYLLECKYSALGGRDHFYRNRNSNASPFFFFLFFLLRILRLQKITTTEQKKTFLITIMILLLKSWIIFSISYSCELLEHFYIFEQGEREILHCIVNTNHEKVQGNLMSEKDTRFWLSQPMLYVLVC